VSALSSSAEAARLEADQCTHTALWHADDSEVLLARQPRLILPNHAHLVRQQGHNGQAIVHDARDAQTWLNLLREVAATHKMAVHAWCLREAQVDLLLTPADTLDLSRMLQDLGRRYVGQFNARHGRSGTLWDGRFRCAAVQPGQATLTALLSVERTDPGELGGSSRAHHVGTEWVSWLLDPAEYWSLGNTPFDRHQAWQRQLERGLSRHDEWAVERALRSGIPLGHPTWLQQVQIDTQRRLFPRPRGRPRQDADA
jgi:putative transposase